MGCGQSKAQQPAQMEQTKEEKSVVKEEKSVVKEEKPVVKEAKPVVKEEKPVVKEEKPVVKEEKPVVKETPPAQEPKSVAKEESKPAKSVVKEASTTVTTSPVASSLVARYEGDTVVKGIFTLATEVSPGSGDYLAVCAVASEAGAYETYEYNGEAARNGALSVSCEGYCSAGSAYVLRYYSASDEVIVESEAFVYTHGEGVEQSPEQETQAAAPAAAEAEAEAQGGEALVAGEIAKNKPGNSLSVTVHQDHSLKIEYTLTKDVSTSDYPALCSLEDPSSYQTYAYPSSADKTGCVALPCDGYMTPGKKYFVRFYDWGGDVWHTSDIFVAPAKGEGAAGTADGGAAAAEAAAVASGVRLPKPDGSVKVTFDPSSQELVVTWAFASYEPSPYSDMLFYYDNAVDDKETYIGADLMSGAAEKGEKRLAIKPFMEEGKSYYVRWGAAGQPAQSVATSEPFAMSGVQARASQDLVTMKLVAKELRTEGAFEQPTLDVEFAWKTPGDRHATKSAIAIFMLPEEEDLDNAMMWPMATLLPGKESGLINLAVGGYVTDTSTKVYVAFIDYEATPYVTYGKTESFTVPMPSKGTPAELKQNAMMYNAMSSTRMMAAAAMAKTQLPRNPLLDVEPQPDQLFTLLQEREAKLQAKKEAVSEEAAAAAPVSVPEPDVASEMGILSEEQFAPLVAEALTAAQASGQGGGFIYAGAGVSMDAPAAAPSWWALMQETLQATFGAVPQEHAALVAKLSVSDSSRNPEEIMESYYYVIKDKLMTLFKLLEEGEPNANHKAMAAMAARGLVRGIMTTNFDRFIERALELAGVSYKLVVTDEEYQEYLASGCKEFAVLKIHGTVERPDTIVAVANHYKTGKGFGGYKAVVLRHFLKEAPTLFWGYSGWDFVHANYQAFWATVGEAGGQNVYYLVSLMFGAPPDLRRLIGTHIGKRLIIGDSLLPRFACKVLKDDTYEQMHQAVGDQRAAKETAGVARRAFIKKWVEVIPKPHLYTLLMMEATRLNKTMQDRIENMKNAGKGGSSQSASVDSNAATAIFTKLGQDVATGKITQAESDRKIAEYSFSMLLPSMYVPEPVKQELKSMYMQQIAENPLFTTDPDAAYFRGILPSVLMGVAQGASYDDANAKDIVEQSLSWLQERYISNYRKKDDPKAQALYQIWQRQSFAAGANGEDAAKIEAAAEACANDIVAKGITDQGEMGAKIDKEVGRLVKELLLGFVSVFSVIKSQCVAALQVSDPAEFQDAAMVVALGLFRQAEQSATDMLQNQRYASRVLAPLATNGDAAIDKGIFESVDEELDAELPPEFAQLVARLREVGASEVLSAFTVAKVARWMYALKYAGTKWQDEQARDRRGFYPRETLPSCAVAYLRPLVEEARKQVKDDRLVQPVLQYLMIIGDSIRDIDLMQSATDDSLALTAGVVTELTPHPIPEALAYARQDAGEYEASFAMYAKALDGLKTAVVRTKADAIVLNACLVAAKVKGPEQALKWAFTYSPQYATGQSYAIVGPCRAILVQQADVWAKSLGHASVDAAEAAMMSSD